MANVAVLTDSTASIPENLLESLHIHTIAYYIHRGQEVLRDLVTIQREEFLRWLITTRFLPTTASPGPGDYLEAYKRLAGEGIQEILSVQMSSKVSGGFQAATMMQDECPEVRVEVVDTQNAALCQGWMVIEDGVIAPLGRARSWSQAYQQMAEMVAEAVGQGKAKIAYMRAGARREVEKIRDLVEARADVVESLIADLSPALAVHTGPGTAGLCYYPVES